MADPEVKTVSNDAVFLLGKATEFFVQYYALEGFNQTKECFQSILAKAFRQGWLIRRPSDYIFGRGDTGTALRTQRSERHSPTGTFQRL